MSEETLLDTRLNYTGVYIAGPMRGRIGFNFAAFQKVQGVVERFFNEREDLLIANPARMDIERSGLQELALREGWEAAGVYLQENPAADFNLRTALGEDLAFIAEHGTDLVLLPEWEGSAGVKAEKALADALGLNIWYLHPETGLLTSKNPADVPSEPTLGDRMAAMLRPRAKTGAELHQQGIERRAEKAARLVENLLTETRTTSSTGGQKGVKLARFDLIPAGPLREVAEHYGRGAAKYDDGQWRQGYEWSKSIAAMHRHNNDFEDTSKSDYDVCPEDGAGCRFTDMDGNPYEAIPSEHGGTCFNHTGSHHMAASVWHGLFLLEAKDHWAQLDDRFRYPEDKDA